MSIYKYVLTGLILCAANTAFSQGLKLPTKKPGTSTSAKKTAPAAKPAAPAAKKTSPATAPAQKSTAHKSASPVPTKKAATPVPTKKPTAATVPAKPVASHSAVPARKTTTAKTTAARRPAVSHAAKNYTYAAVKNAIPLAEILSVGSVSDMSSLLGPKGFRYSHVALYDDANYYVWTLNSSFTPGQPETVRPTGNGISCMVENCETPYFSGIRITVFSESVKKHLQTQMNDVHRYRTTKFVVPWADGEYYDYAFNKTDGGWTLFVYGAYFGARGSVQTLANATANVSSASSSSQSGKVYDVVEQMPEFPGGMKALNRWLAENVVYPALAAENGVQGRVVVSFIVDRDGSISNAKIARSVDPTLDREALRVVSKMPQWKPGKQDGKPVRVKYSVPVTFRLS